jgi:type II secretory pathway pseudopilin PulG
MTPDEGTDAFGNDPLSDDETRARLDAIEEATEEHLGKIGKAYAKFNRRVSWLLRIGVLAGIAAAAVFTYQLGVNSDRADEARNLGRQIQNERIRNVRDSCEATNERHNDTVATIDQVLVQSVATQQKGKASDADQKALDALSAKAAKTKDPRQIAALLAQARKLVTPAFRRQIDQSRGQTVFIIDALAPVRDCDQVVHDQIKIRQ